MAKKKKNSRGYPRRNVNTREVKQRFLIVCGGEETEKNYFDCFRIPGNVTRVRGLNKDPDTLINKTIGYQEEDEYDQVWCVFDKDDFHNFNSTIEKAKNEGFYVAYSNEAFELWYVLHFEFLSSGIPRQDYINKLNKLLGKKYKKNSDSIYDELFDKQETAIKNAENLFRQYNKPNPAQDNPSTTVHLLVKALNQQYRK
ncbi:MAG: RloB family protein [Crocosphaera sp.]|nr:RloB family protein [Crocosphaera sp.]